MQVVVVVVVVTAALCNPSLIQKFINLLSNLHKVAFQRFDILKLPLRLCLFNECFQEGFLLEEWLEGLGEFSVEIENDIGF